MPPLHRPATASHNNNRCSSSNSMGDGKIKDTTMAVVAGATMQVAALLATAVARTLTSHQQRLHRQGTTTARLLLGQGQAQVMVHQQGMTTAQGLQLAALACLHAIPLLCLPPRRLQHHLCRAGTRSPAR